MKIVLAVLIVLACIFFRDHLESLLNKLAQSIHVNNTDSVNIFTPEQLSLYDGVQHKKIYLSLMGSIFDVTAGVRHYGQGGPYSYFAGKDGSRSFITGDFKDESANKDNVLDLSCDDLFTLTNWKETLREKYLPVGVLVGRYYDTNGKETVYLKQFLSKQSQCEAERQAAKLEEQTMPPCNMEWNADTGTRVWCTKTSGGVKRTWIGVPRQFYSPGKEHPRCVCVNLEHSADLGLLKEYEGCPITSIECTFKSA
ncbi:neuferricin [Amyelois transitella]|uniref:neuferricin n=1 Tax=Amyelois transitella TaxID=680683 RepID=UPI00067C6D29|nr:neuferricin [Amyelois transitella]